MAAMRQVVDGPGGQEYVVTAHRVAARPPLADVLAGTRFLPDASEGRAVATTDRPAVAWEVRVESAGRHQVFEAGNGEIAERLMVLLGEEVELGLLEL